MMLYLRILIGALLSVLPSVPKIWLYRLLYGYQIGRGVRIGFGVLFVNVKSCRIAEGTKIGPMNVFCDVGELRLGRNVRVDYFNVFRGGDRIEVGDYATILRGNVFNSILHADVVTTPEPVLRIGEGVVVTTGHWLDFTDRITVEAHSIIGGRNSSFWTHNRQRTRPIHIGPHCYFGSEIRAAPGVEVPAFCIVALGSVLMGVYDLPRSLISGNPARIRRPLRERDLFLVTRKTRNDMPDEIAFQHVQGNDPWGDVANPQPAHVSSRSKRNGRKRAVDASDA